MRISWVSPPVLTSFYAGENDPWKVKDRVTIFIERFGGYCSKVVVPGANPRFQG